MNKVNQEIFKKSGIYIFTNCINGKRYIGSSIDLGIRIRTHIWELNRNDHCNQHLQNSWNKHGEEAFVWGILEICDELDRFDREQFYLDTLQPEYNIRTTVDNKVADPETYRKISEAMKKWHSENESPNLKYIETVYVYDTWNWTFCGEYNNLSTVAKCFYKKSGSFKFEQLNRGLIYDRYVVTNIKFQTILEMQNFISENALRYRTENGNLKYLIVENKNNSEMFYAKTIPEVIRRLNKSSASTLKKHMTADKQNPYNIPNTNYIMYVSNTYIPLESRLNEESLRLLSGNIEESPLQDNIEINSELKNLNHCTA